MIPLIMDGILLGAIIALGAIGLTLEYGILRFANFSHGDLMTVGAYFTLFLLGIFGTGTHTLGPLSFGWPMIASLVLSMAGTAVVAVMADRMLFKRLRRRRASPVVLAIAALGLAFIIRSLIFVLWGSDFIFYTFRLRPAYLLPYEIRIKADQLFILAAAGFFLILSYIFLRFTKLGKAMRATADNEMLARVTGIDTERVAAWTWVLAGATAAAAGTLLGIESQLRPEMGWFFLLPLFAAVILGGVGSPTGAVVGSLSIGIVQQVSTAYVLPTYKPAVAFSVLIAILLLRPRGIFGR